MVGTKPTDRSARNADFRHSLYDETVVRMGISDGRSWLAEADIAGCYQIRYRNAGNDR